MTKLDELFNAKAEPPRHCQFAVWLQTQPEEDRHSIYRAFDNPEIGTRHIFKTLRSIGCPNGESSIRSHRHGECKTCERNRTNA